LLLGGQRIRNERNKRWKPAESGAIGSAPGGGIARRKISSGYEVGLKKLGNALIHDRPKTAKLSFYDKWF